MPEPNDNFELNDGTEIRNQRQVLEEAIRNPGNEFPELQEAHQKMVQSLKSLVEETDRLYTKDETGHYPKMDNNEQKKMVDLYRNAIDAVEEYRAGVTKSGLESVEKKRIADPIAGLMGKIEDVMGGDFRVLLSAARHGNKSLPDVIRHARTNMVDLGSQNTAKAGANMNSRLRMKVSGADGNAIEGFFTEDTQQLKSVNIVENEAYQKLVADTKGIVSRATLGAIVTRMKDFFKKYNYGRTDVLEICDETYYGMERDKGYISPDQVIMECINAVSGNDEEDEMQLSLGDDIVPQMFEGTGLGQKVAEYFTTIYQYRNKHGLLTNDAAIETTDNLNRRNSAMSDIAQLLDMGELIAYSESMTIRQGDRQKRGTFMEKAKGEDCEIRNMGSVFAEPGAFIDVNHPHLKEQLADLQVLDYICGNIDRHSGNMLYQFDRSDPKNPICTGIQGIDNDTSFGKRTDGYNRLPKISKMGVISERTALIVNNLSPAVLKTTLRNYNFSKNEMEAVVIRTKNIQDAIKDKKIKIVAKDEWENLHIASINGAYFQNITKMARNAEGYLAGTLYEESDKNYKKNFTAVYKLRKPLQQLGTLLETADQNIWRGSEEFSNTRKSFAELIKDYDAGMKNPTAENLYKLKNTLEETLKNAEAYSKMKHAKHKLNTKEKRRLDVIDKILNFGRTEGYAIGMLEKCCMQENQLKEWDGKSFDSITQYYLTAMRNNVENYPEGSERRKDGENAIKSVEALARMAKSDISADLNTQRSVATHMAVILKYDPELMNKTELTYAYGSVGDHGRKRALESAMDIVTFLNDVYINEKIKAPTMEARAEKEIQSEKAGRSKENQTERKTHASQKSIPEKQKNVPGK